MWYFILNPLFPTGGSLGRRKMVGNDFRIITVLYGNKQPMAKQK